MDHNGIKGEEFLNPTNSGKLMNLGCPHWHENGDNGRRRVFSILATIYKNFFDSSGKFVVL